MPYSYEYPRPAVTVDSLIFNIEPLKGLEILLIERAKAPFKDNWAIPGGFVDMDEDLIIAAKRELAEETGMHIDTLEEVGTFAKPGRDPRGRVISIAFWGIADKTSHQLKAADDAKNYCWKNISTLPKLAFDHTAIIEAALKAFRTKILDQDFLKKHFIDSNSKEDLLLVCKQIFTNSNALKAFDYIEPILNYNSAPGFKDLDMLRIFLK